MVCYDRQYLAVIWNLRVQKNLNIEKIIFKVNISIQVLCAFFYLFPCTFFNNMFIYYTFKFFKVSNMLILNIHDLSILKTDSSGPRF